MYRAIGAAFMMYLGIITAIAAAIAVLFTVVLVAIGAA